MKHGEYPSTPTQPCNAPQSLSPIHRQLHSSSPSSNDSVPPSMLRVSPVLKERRFDCAPGAIDYEWVAAKSVERKALVEKLLRSPRPPTSDDKRRALADSDSKFDAFSEHDPKVRGLKQLYIPPPSPAAPSRVNCSAMFGASSDKALEYGIANASSSNVPVRPARRLDARPEPFVPDSDRFDSFPDQP